MLDQILRYILSIGDSRFERLLAALLPVVCLSTTAYMSFSYLGRRLVENRRGGMFRFAFYCLFRMIAFTGLLLPWVVFLCLAYDVALHP